MELLNSFTFWFFFLAAYLLGSVPWGLLFARMFTGKDIRRQGSGNIGATNVGRIAGITPGVLTLAADMAKGALPVWLAVVATRTGGNGEDLFVGLVALAAFLGHLYPCFLKFKGGKGVAVAGGCFLFVSPVAIVLAVFVFIAVAFFTKRVSAGSLAAAAILPAGIWIFHHSYILTACAGIIAVFVFFRHTENIRRMVAGIEPEFSLKKSDDGP